ncbi:MAG TPA: hypothetical protein VNG69_17385, partial [Casimicrobiaceae bacterium]|nr:hypothetical protein [Casimicrobiaceae bacterium]
MPLQKGVNILTFLLGVCVRPYFAYITDRVVSTIPIKKYKVKLGRYNRTVAIKESRRSEQLRDAIEERIASAAYPPG